jgi:ribosomal protein S18 acetylase RimI-like enzyme
MTVTVAVGEVDHDLATLLDERINAFNATTTGHHDGRLLSVRLTAPSSDATAAAPGDATEVLAGLYGWTWGRCGFIDLLWVDEQHRGRGLGDTVMDAAEAEMAARGCEQVVVSSHSFQAPGFYARRGYREVCRVEGYPAGHSHVTLVKPL